MAVLVVAIIGSILVGTRVSDASLTPNLALDLEGGTQLILAPVTDDGSEITDEDVDQAIEIIRQRVDASGVAEAEITSQGEQNIVVGLPGTPSEETLDLVRRSAQLRFRPVLISGGPGVIDPVALAEEDESFEMPGEPPAEGEAPTQEQIEAAATYVADSSGDGELSTEPLTEEPLNNSDLAWVTEQMAYDFYTLNCADPANLVGGRQDDPGQPIAACSMDGSAKYVLGPTDVEGVRVDGASSGLGQTSSGATTGEWVVNIDLDGEGTGIFADVSERLVSLEPPRNQFGIVLDGLVVSAPTMNDIIPDGNAQISGTFDRETAASLANQLNFGSLPLNFEVQSEEQISATLGTEQLRNGLLAGVIGLGLVALYLLWQYRGLAAVAVSSLLMAAVLTYGTITFLSWTAGYRLSLAGVAGLIVAVGITADSFILYFERIRDEVRDGRSLESAIHHGWSRARRTIIISDVVTLLAAVVLYFLSVGGVRGFAFTLGLTTVLDIVVVFFFTHPLLQLLIRTRFFGNGHRLSGLDPETLGATRTTYRGRGRVEPAAAVTGGKRRGSPAEPAEPRRTIAERRAAERRAAEEAAERQDDPDSVDTTSGGER